MDPELLAIAARVGQALKDRGETVGVAEGSCGGLVSAALLAVPGRLGVLRRRRRDLHARRQPGVPGRRRRAAAGMRGASEPFATFLARSAVVKLDATWGIGEGGAAGPTGNRYGDPAGHAWLAVVGAAEATRNLLTGSDDRLANMTAFATAAIALLGRAARAQLRSTTQFTPPNSLTT